MRNKTDENGRTNKMDGQIRWTDEKDGRIRWTNKMDEIGRTLFNCRLTRSRPTKTNSIKQYIPKQYYKQPKSTNSTPNGI